MTPRARAIARLYAVQAAYTYERMGGIGVGYASQPLLADVMTGLDPVQRAALLERSAEFFNSHPYVAAVAVGATVRAEREHLPAPVVLRLRRALSGPLGSLGDRLVWAGEVPALMALALVGGCWFGGWAVLVAVVAHNVFRIELTTWGLDLGLREGIGVGAALERSRLPHLAEVAQNVAAITVGAALPVVASFLLSGTGIAPIWLGAVVVTAILGSGLSIAAATRTRATGLRFGLLLLAGTAILVGVVR